MGDLNVEDFKLLLEDRPAWEAKSKKDREDLVRASPAQLEVLWTSLLSDVDRAEITAEISEFLINAIREGLRESDAGMVDDSISQVRPWGFAVDRIHVPTQIWHGDQDRFVPFQQGQWLAAHVPRTDAHLLQGEGHVTVLHRHVPDAQSWIASLA